jgi:uncharacterized protein (TIGR03435 family)
MPSYKLTCSLALVVAAAGALAQADALKVGEPAPRFTLATTFQGPKSANLDTLKGQVVVLEFWATWCAPCIGAMPHLNELAEKFKDRKVTFLAVSNEEPGTVESFLKRGLLKTWVATDPSGKMFKDYGVLSIPKTVVLDRGGKVALATHPNALQAEHIESVLRGETVKSEPETKPAATMETAPEPLLHVEVRPSRGGNYSMVSRTTPERAQFKAEAVPLLHILQTALRVSSPRIIVERELPEGLFDFTVVVPRNRNGELHETAKRALEDALGLRAVKEVREMPVLVLRAPQGPGPELKDGSTSSLKMSTSPGAFSATGYEISNMASYLENVLRMPVVDETGLTGKYDWLLTFDQKNPQSVKEALRPLGLELQEATRQIEVYAIR